MYNGNPSDIIYVRCFLGKYKRGLLLIHFYPICIEEWGYSLYKSGYLGRVPRVYGNHMVIHEDSDISIPFEVDSIHWEEFLL